MEKHIVNCFQHKMSIKQHDCDIRSKLQINTVVLHLQ